MKVNSIFKICRIIILLNHFISMIFLNGVILAILVIVNGLLIILLTYLDIIVFTISGDGEE